MPLPYPPPQQGYAPGQQFRLSSSLRNRDLFRVNSSRHNNTHHNSSPAAVPAATYPQQPVQNYTYQNAPPGQVNPYFGRLSNSSRPDRCRHQGTTRARMLMQTVPGFTVRSRALRQFQLIIQVMSSRTHEELILLGAEYKQCYGRELAHVFHHSLTGSFEQL